MNITMCRMFALLILCVNLPFNQRQDLFTRTDVKQEAACAVVIVLRSVSS